MPHRHNNVSDQQIVDMYQRTGSGNQTARQLGVSAPTVYTVLHRHSVTLTRRTGKLRAADEDIAAAYRRTGNGLTVAKELHVCDKTVYDTLKKMGVHTDGHVRLRKVQGENEQRVLDLNRAGRSIREICDELGLKSYSVWSALNRANAFGSRKLTDDQKTKAAELYTSGLTCAETGAAIGHPTHRILKFLQRERPELIRRLGKGEHSPTWNGGRGFHKKSGYWYVYVPDTDPYAAMRSKAGYVPEHRIVMARKLGRLLAVTETVHHIDMDKTNNAEANLQLRHGKHGKNIVPCCMDCGSRNIGTAPLD